MSAIVFSSFVFESINMNNKVFEQLITNINNQLTKLFELSDVNRGILFYLYNPIVKNGKIIDLEESLNKHLHEHQEEREEREKEERVGKHDWKILVFRILGLIVGGVIAAELGILIFTH